MAPSYLSELLVRYEPMRSLRSSQRDLYVVPPISTNFYGKRSFGHAAPELWNGIPNDIKRAGTKERFKTSLKTYLFRKWCTCSVCYTVIPLQDSIVSNCFNFLFFLLLFSPKVHRDLAKGIMRYIRTVIIIIIIIINLTTLWTGLMLMEISKMTIIIVKTWRRVDHDYDGFFTLDKAWKRGTCLSLSAQCQKSEPPEYFLQYHWMILMINRDHLLVVARGRETDTVEVCSLHLYEMRQQQQQRKLETFRAIFKLMIHYTWMNEWMVYDNFFHISTLQLS